MNENEKQAEPVAFVDANGDLIAKTKLAPWTNLYTHPAQPVQPAGAQGEPLCYLRPDDVVGFVPCAEDDEDGFPVYTEAPAAAINEQMKQALEFFLERFQPIRSELLFSQRLAIDKARAAIAEAEKAKGGV